MDTYIYTYTRSNKYAFIQTHTYREEYTLITPIQLTYTQKQKLPENFFQKIWILKIRKYLDEKKFQPKRITNKNYLGEKNFRPKMLNQNKKDFSDKKIFRTKTNFQVKKLFDQKHFSTWYSHTHTMFSSSAVTFPGPFELFFVAAWRQKNFWTKNIFDKKL